MVGRGDVEASCGGGDLVFGPGGRKVLEAAPKGRKTPLDLEHAHGGLAEVFRADVGAEGHEIAAVDVLFAHTAFALDETGLSLTLEPPGLPLLPSFPPWRILGAGRSLRRYAEQATQVVAATRAAACS